MMSSRYLCPATLVRTISAVEVTGIVPGSSMMLDDAARCRLAALPTPISPEPLMSHRSPPVSATASSFFDFISPPGLV